MTNENFLNPMQVFRVSPEQIKDRQEKEKEEQYLYERLSDSEKIEFLKMKEMRQANELAALTDLKRNSAPQKDSSCGADFSLMYFALGTMF